MLMSVLHVSIFANLQKIVDDVDGFCGDFLPWVRWVHEAGILDLLIYVLILIERECSRQAYLDRDRNIIIYRFNT